MAVNLQLGLPGIKIGIDDIGGVFGSRRKRGPFLIISRVCGRALDTCDQSHDGAPASARPTDASVGQLWYLEPTGSRRGVHHLSS